MYCHPKKMTDGRFESVKINVLSLLQTLDHDLTIAIFCIRIEALSWDH